MKCDISVIYQMVYIEKSPQARRAGISSAGAGEAPEKIRLKLKRPERADTNLPDVRFCRPFRP